MHNSKPQEAGLCWIKPEQWQRLLEVAEDKASLESSWKEWEAKSLEMIEVFATRNIFIQKIEIDVEELINWCQNKDKPINSSTRAEYITELMLELKKSINEQTKH